MKSAIAAFIGIALAFLLYMVLAIAGVVNNPLG
jgi:hypothetical protein